MALKEKKTCNGCDGAETTEYQHSMEWEMFKEFSTVLKRQTILIFVILGLWFATIAGFVWHITQYDYTDYEVQQDGEWGNTFIDGGNEGDITYGTENTSSQENTQKATSSEG